MGPALSALLRSRAERTLNFGRVCFYLFLFSGNPGAYLFFNFAYLAFPFL